MMGWLVGYTKAAGLGVRERGYIWGHGSIGKLNHDDGDGGDHDSGVWVGKAGTARGPPGACGAGGGKATGVGPDAPVAAANGLACRPSTMQRRPFNSCAAKGCGGAV